MAKQSKADTIRARSGALSESTFFGFLKAVKKTAQELADAGMTHAGEFKKADALGIHRDAIKLAIRFDKMEDTKRDDILRSFDRYRAWLGWDSQRDLVDLIEADAADEGDDGEGETEGAAPQGETESEAGPGELDFSAEDPAPKPEVIETAAADWGEEGLIPHNAAEIAQNAAQAFSAGEDAGKDGDGAASNPHPTEHPFHLAWERGRKNGEIQAAASLSAGDAEADALATAQA